MKKKKTQASAFNKYLLIGLSVFCILMMTLSVVSEKTKGPFKMIAEVTVVPLQKGINHIGSWMGDMKDNFQTLKEVRAENKKLQEQVDSLVIENNNLQQERYELERLQELYQLDQSYSDYKKTAAHVIGNDSGNWFSTFTIDKGSNDGIAKDMNVMAGSGLVGIVTDVGPNYAKVTSIINDTSKVSGMVTTTSDNLIVSGSLQKMNEDMVIEFNNLNDKVNEVSINDPVVTSAVSYNYQQGILIGYISSIETDSNNLTKSGTITPAVDFEHIEEVLVNLNKKLTVDI